MKVDEIKGVFPLPFTKMSGSGNDFLIIDHRRKCIPQNLQPSLVERVCRRMFSAGGDGVILIEESENADFRWQFYNADGSVAEMCGNGARCAARFAFVNNIAAETMCFETVAGVIEAQIGEGQQVRISMTEPGPLRENLEVDTGLIVHGASFINTGVPHVVIFVDEGDIPVKKWGRTVRMDRQFQPDGTNVNFVTMLDAGEIRARTYERGVEDETRACGTGAVASAIVTSKKGMTKSPVTVVTSGGDRLVIDFDLQGGCAKKVHLTGPAHIIYHGELTAESLL